MINLVFLDESEALTHPYLACCWARRGTELRIQAPGQAKKRAMLGAFDPVRRQLLVHASPTKRSTDFVALDWPSCDGHFAQLRGHGTFKA